MRKTKSSRDLSLRMLTSKIKDGSTQYNYVYDTNGNMTTDGRRGLNIEYNMLNLPKTVKEGTVIKATYTYLADGTKVEVNNSSNSGYTYLGSLIYKKTGATRILEAAQFSNGIIYKTTTSYDRKYYTTDHLGSIRVIFNNSGIMDEYNDYYPFGLNQNQNTSYPTLPDNRYKFSGKELQTMVSESFDYLDFGARMYDPVIARWSSVDPLAEKYYSLSGYNYCANNPVRLVDPTGKDWYSYDEKYLNEYGEENTRTAYRYTTEYRSQEALDKAGIKGTYMGVTAKAKNTYFSLLGETFDIKNNDGNLSLSAQIAEKLDNAIINYYKGDIIDGSGYYTRYTDMTISGLKIGSGFQFSYGLGTVTYSATEDNTQGYLDFGTGKMSSLHGFFRTLDEAVNVRVRKGGRKDWDIAYWRFKDVPSYNSTKDHIDKLLLNRYK